MPEPRNCGCSFADGLCEIEQIFKCKRHGQNKKHRKTVVLERGNVAVKLL